MNGDPYIAAQDKMPAWLREKFIERAYDLWPAMRGAHTADILDQLDNTDWQCGEVEGWLETSEFNGYKNEVAVPAILVYLVLDEDVPLATIKEVML